MWLFAAGLAAFAQDTQPDRFNGQVLRPSIDATHMLWSDESVTAPDGYLTARAFLQYANGMVRNRRRNGNVDRLVSDAMEVDLLGAWHWRGLRLGAHVPLYVVTAGDGFTTEPGLGDIAVDLKATVFDRDRDPIGAALLARLALPTASVDVPLGAAGTGWEVMGIVDKDLEPITLVANIGLRDVPRAVLDGIVWNDQIFARIGGAYAFNADTGVSAELAAQTNFASEFNPAGTPVELLLGGYTPMFGDFVLRGGGALGLSRSPGAPVFRVLLGVSWEPDPMPDRDLDGFTDREDGCPDAAEDLDGYADFDGCPDPAFTAQIEVVGPDGEPLEATVVLDGTDRTQLDAGDNFAVLHPGRYRVVAHVDGYLPWAGELDVPAEQGHKVKIPVEPRRGTLKLWAVDTEGARLPAQVSVDGGRPVAADGEGFDVGVGEHALVVTAPGYRAKAASISVAHGQQRALSIVLERRAGRPEPKESP